MGIFGALATAISGLRAQSTALEHISGNIANSQTTAYKRTETRFVDYVPDAALNQQVAKGVAASSRSTNNIQGEVNRAGIGTYMAINGSGFFVIEQSIGVTDGRPQFDGSSLYTRRGDFELDRNGYLVNGAGYYLKGLVVDRTTGNVAGSNPEVIQVTNDFLPAKATSEISYRANLPAYPLTSNADPDTPGSELLDRFYFTGPVPADPDNPDPDDPPYMPGRDPTTSNPNYNPADPSTRPFVDSSGETEFLNSSIAGSAITIYTEAGNAVNVQLRWAKTDDDTWNLFYLENSNAGPGQPMWRNVGVDYTFDSDGQLANNQPQAVTLSGLSVNGVGVGDVTLRHGNRGVTSFADANGSTKVTELSQDGYAAGELMGISVTERGRVRASYTNGQSIDIAEIATARFNAENMLKKLDGGAFQATEESGNPILGAQGSIVGSALEGSNTDIAEEFSKLIVTQQAYAAGTRIVTTSNDMLQEALNMLR